MLNRMTVGLVGSLAKSYRMVGGFVGLGSTFLCRLRFSLTIGLFWGFLCLTHHQGIGQAFYVFWLCSVMAYLGRLIGHSPYMGVASLRNALMMALIGFGRLSLIMLPYAVLNWWDVFALLTDPLAALDVLSFSWTRMAVGLFGVMEGVAYYVGNKYLDRQDSGIYFRGDAHQWRINAEPYTIHDGNADPSEVLECAAIGGSEWGELLTGIGSYQIPYMLLLVML